MKKSKVSAIIIDDEKLAREITRGYLKKNSEVEINELLQKLND